MRRHSPLPWALAQGVVYDARGESVILADRSNLATSGAERDDNLRLVVAAVNAWHREKKDAG